MISSQRPPSTSLLRYAAVAILFVTVSTCTLQVLAAVEQLGKLDAPTPGFAGFIPPLLSLLLGLGMSAVIDGLARLLEREPEPHSDEQAAAIDHLTQAVIELRTFAQSPAARPSPAQPPLVISPSSNGDRHLQRVVQLLEEMKASAQPPLAGSPSVHLQGTEAAPQPRAQPEIQPPAEQLAAAPPALSEAEAVPPPAGEVPDEIESPAANHEIVEPEMRETVTTDALAMDPAFATQLANELDADAVELEQLQRHVEELMSIADYDTALLAASQFTERRPHSPAGPALVQRIVNEAALFGDRTTSRLFEEIRANVERRQWRRALEVSQTLLGQFPDHPRSAKIRQQLRPIQHNAEIEERQLLETRINESVTAQRFPEAIDLSEDLLRRFPNSPQAATLSDLLPKLRQRAVREMRETAGSGAFAG